jgi:hypothetical protein
MSVPIVFNFIICSSWKMTRNFRPFVAKEGMESNDSTLFSIGKFASPDIRPEIIHPPEPTALATAVKSSELRKRPPIPITILVYISSELIIFFWQPRSFLHAFVLIATR